MALLMMTGCAIHQPRILMAAPDPMIVEAKQFVHAVAEKMPEWDADEAYARYEREEIATVKADIEVARQERIGRYFEDVNRLRDDWNKLLALDLMLQRSYVI